MSSRADQLASQAMRAYERESFEEAIDIFKDARDEYLAEDLPLKAAEMANNLSVTLGRLDRHQSGLDVLEGVFELFLQHEDMTKAAQTLGNKAAAYEGLGEWAEAESLYRQAADRFGQIGEEESQRFTLQALSRVRLRQGRAMEAVSTMQDALETGGGKNWRSKLVRKILALPSRLMKP